MCYLPYERGADIVANAYATEDLLDSSILLYGTSLLSQLEVLRQGVLASCQVG